MDHAVCLGVCICRRHGWWTSSYKVRLRSNRIIRHMWKHLGLALASCTFRPVDPTPTSLINRKIRVKSLESIPPDIINLGLGLSDHAKRCSVSPRIQEPPNDFGFSNKNNVPNSLSLSPRAKLSLNKALSLSLSPDQLLIPS